MLTPQSPLLLKYGPMDHTFHITKNRVRITEFQALTQTNKTRVCILTWVSDGLHKCLRCAENRASYNLDWKLNNITNIGEIIHNIIQIFLICPPIKCILSILAQMYIAQVYAEYMCIAEYNKCILYNVYWVY